MEKGLEKVVKMCFRA